MILSTAAHLHPSMMATDQTPTTIYSTAPYQTTVSSTLFQTVIAFSKTQLPAGALMQISSCILHTPLKEKGPWGPLLSALPGASKRETPTSNLTESTADYHNIQCQV